MHTDELQGLTTAVLEYDRYAKDVDPDGVTIVRAPVELVVVQVTGVPLSYIHTYIHMPQPKPNPVSPHHTTLHYTLVLPHYHPITF